MNEKLKVVRYTKLLEPPVVGRTAIVFPVDHPGERVSNKTWAVTSEVQAVTNCPDGGVEFDTLYTRYVPA